MSYSAVSLAGVSYCFGSSSRPALDNITAQIRHGKITGLVGPDGAGKTTLMRLMAGLLLPCGGTITACGFDTVTQADDLHTALGYMPQRFGLYEDLSVIENLNLYADLQGVTGKTRLEIFERLLKFTDLSSFQKRLAGRLSGGMKQKLGLACALIKKPQLLLLDEPSVGVDPISRRELWGMVRKLVDQDISVVWSTAYLDEAQQCDEVLLLHEGKLLFNGVPSGLTQRVDERVFLLEGIPSQNRRAALSQILLRDEILDGLVQGSDIRLVVKKGRTAACVKDICPGQNLQITVVQPRFEDAFIDILGDFMPLNHKSLLAERAEAIPDDGKAVVEAHGLTKRFGAFTAVHDNSFSIKRGEIFGLLGPNGAGKSTTFKMMCGLLKPTSGRGFVAGYDLRHSASQARSRLGYMAQKFSLYGYLSVKQNLKFFSGVYGLGGKKQRQAVESMIEVFNLEEYLSAPAGELPLGFKQRLALACAVMHKPDVLFLDEPTSGVDPLTRREFWTHINGLVEKGVTILVTTHFMDEAEYCDRIGLIYRGRKIAEGSPDDLKGSVSSENLRKPTLEDAFIALIEQFDRQYMEARQ